MFGDHNDHNFDSNNVVFTVKGTRLYVLVAALSAKDNQKLAKVLSKGFERSVYLNEYKTKSESKNTMKEYRYFLESNFLGVKILFVLVYQIKTMQNEIKLKDVIYQKVLLTLPVQEKLKNSIFEILIIPQTLKINNYRTKSVKLINLHIIKKLIEYS